MSISKKKACEKILTSLSSIKENLNIVFPDIDISNEAKFSGREMLLLDRKKEMLGNVRKLTHNLLIMIDDAKVLGLKPEKKESPDYETLKHETYKFMHSIPLDWTCTD